MARKLNARLKKKSKQNRAKSVDRNAAPQNTFNDQTFNERNRAVSPSSDGVSVQMLGNRANLVAVKM